MEENKEELELIVSPIDKIKEITVNYDQLKNALGNRLQGYKNMKYSEEEIDLAKKDRATLNKLDSAIKGKITEIRKELLDPFTTAESELKELSSMVKEASNCIDEQIKNYETKAQEEKKAQIKAQWDTLQSPYKDLIDFDSIFNPRWLNKTYKKKNIEEDLNHIIVKATEDMSVIDAQIKDETIKKQVQDYYFRNINNPSILGNALTEAQRIIESNKKLETLAPRAIADVDESHVINKEQYGEIENFLKQGEEQEQLQVIDFRVWVTQEQKMMIREFLIKNNIKYGGVK